MASPGAVDPRGQIILDAAFNNSGTGVDTSRWTNGGGDAGNTQEINTNRLRLVTGAVADRMSFIWQTQLLRDPNQGVLALTEITNTNSSFVIVARAASTTWGASALLPNDSYACRFGLANGNLVISKATGSVVSTVASTTGFSWTSPIKYWVRFEVVGHTLRAKTWADGEREPYWQVDTTDLTNTGPGRLALGVTTNTTAAGDAKFHRYISYVPGSQSAPLLPIILKGAAGASGTSSTTNAADTSAASGTTTVTGTLARTNANDTSAAAGTTTVVGSLARTNANDTLAGGSVNTGTLATTNADDTSAASGTTTVKGTLARTNANDTLSAAGYPGSPPVVTPAPEEPAGGGKYAVSAATRASWRRERQEYEDAVAFAELLEREDEELLVMI